MGWGKGEREGRGGTITGISDESGGGRKARAVKGRVVTAVRC